MLYAGNYLYDIYIVFGITSNLKMINIWELINRLYEIVSFYLRDLSIDFDIPGRGQGLKINLQWILKNDCLIMKELDNRNNSL